MCSSEKGCAVRTKKLCNSKPFRLLKGKSNYIGIRNLNRKNTAKQFQSFIPIMSFYSSNINPICNPDLIFITELALLMCNSLKTFLKKHFLARIGWDLSQGTLRDPMSMKGLCTRTLSQYGDICVI